MYRILIADDEPMALYSTAHTFPWADWGFDPPVLMTEAPAALDKLRTERFDAAIVDIRMPQMTGIDLIRLSGEAGLQTVFIVLSGYSDFSYVQTALRLSTFDYCLKPILPDAAQAALERLSGRIHDIRVGSDPAFLATLSSTAPLKALFQQRGLPAASPGAPALSGGLAAAFLWIRDGRAVVRGEARDASAAAERVSGVSVLLGGCERSPAVHANDRTVAVIYPAKVA